MNRIEKKLDMLERASLISLRTSVFSADRVLWEIDKLVAGGNSIGRVSRGIGEGRGLTCCWLRLHQSWLDCSHFP